MARLDVSVCAAVSTAMLVACNRPAHPTATATTVAPPPSASPAAAPAPRPEAPASPIPGGDLTPLQAAAPFMDLPVDGHAAAVVSLPLGARGTRPVVVATHGNYDRAEWQCDVWRKIVGDRAFVLCPRGVVRPDSPSRGDVRFSYPTNQALEREVGAALAALHARFPDHADIERPLYTGFSLGAIMGVSIASRDPARYPRLVLIEGGHDKWTPATAASFARGGGRRVLFVCSQPSCGHDARLAGKHLETAGVAARVACGPNVGHSYDGPTAEETRRSLSWVLEDDPRWGEDAPAR